MNTALKVGAYHYDYSFGRRTSRRTTHGNVRLSSLTRGSCWNCRWFFDLEDADQWKERNGYDFTGETATAQCQAWIDNIGLETGVYASYGWLEDRVSDRWGNGGGTPIDWRALNCSVWNAEWGDVDDIKAFVWQDTDKLPIGGQLVDGDYMYADNLFDD
mgnify:CR=1 FL=1